MFQWDKSAVTYWWIMSSFITQRDTWTTARLDPGQARLSCGLPTVWGRLWMWEGRVWKISAQPSYFFRDPKTVLKIKTTKRYSEKVPHFCEYKIFLLVLFACTVLQGPRVGEWPCWEHRGVWRPWPERGTGGLHHGLESDKRSNFHNNNRAYLTGIFMRSKWKNQENSMIENTSWSKPEVLDSLSKAPESHTRPLKVLSLPFIEKGDVFGSNATGRVSSAAQPIHVFFILYWGARQNHIERI